MDVREKMVELLGGCPCESDCEGMVGSCLNRKHGYCNEILKLSYCSVSKLAQHLIDHGVTVQEWISVNDMLPEPFVSVLVQMPGEEPFPTVREGFISNDGIWQSAMFRREPGEVTHWMPIPHPPKGE